MGGGARGLQTIVLDDGVDVIDEADGVIVTELDIDMEELEEQEEEGSVVGLDVATSCCNEVVDEEILSRTRLIPAGAAMKCQYPENTLCYTGISHTQWLGISSAT